MSVWAIGFLSLCGVMMLLAMLGRHRAVRRAIEVDAVSSGWLRELRAGKHHDPFGANS